MTAQQRAPWDLYAPADRSTLPRQTQNAPTEQPSLSELWRAGRTTAQADLPTASADWLADAWAPVIEELNAAGGSTRWRNPMAQMTNGAQYLIAGGPWGGYGAAARDRREAETWAAVEQARARDPKAFASLPKTLDAFHDQVTSRARNQVLAAQGVQARNRSWSGSAVGLGAGFVTSFQDPINVIALPVGGFGTSVARRIAAEALANAAVEAVEQPFIAGQRKELGFDLTGKEAATNVALAGGFGAVFQGGIEGVGRLARSERVGGAVAQGRALARDMRERIGWSRMTDQERVATTALEREADVAETAPVTGGGAIEHHLSRVDEAMRYIDDPAAYARVMAGLSPQKPLNLSVAEAEARRQAKADAAAGFDRVDYAHRVSQAESGGRPKAQAETSSAFGLYQITRGTWLRYKNLLGSGALTDEAAWGMRHVPVMQEKVFRALTEDNRRALARAGVPETAGNLYLAHFAGSGAATKVLRAARDTPLEGLLSARAIEANAFLKSKTAGELIDWAHAKMGGKAPDGPVLSREGFADDDTGDAEWRAAQGEVEAAEARFREASRDEDSGAADEPIAREADDDVPFDLDDPRARRSDEAEVDPFAGLDDEPAARVDGEDAAPVRVDNDGADLDRPIVDAPSEVPDDWPDWLRERVAEARPENRASMIEAMRPMAAEVLADQRIVAATLDALPPHIRKHLDRVPHEATVKDGKTWVDLRDARDQLWSWQPESGRLISVRGREATEIVADAADFAAATKLDTIPTPVRRTVEASGQAPSVEPLTGFDHPDDVAVARQIDSLEHDLRMWLAEDEAAGITVRLTEDGDVMSAADALADLDLDEAAIDAARACMVPGGEA